jgi:AraC-like DNA-binding protein
VDAPETAALVHSVIRRLCAGPPPPYALDERVVRALELIRRMDTKKISLETVAKAVFLSPSRFAHLFTEQVGLPFRRYVLWRRLTRAMLAVGRGSTLSAAAHACGFADSAHLTRACYQMLGLAPSVLLSPGEYYEIPAPFELPFPTA